MKDYKSALKPHQRALQIRSMPNEEHHSDTRDSYRKIGLAQQKLKNYKSASESHQRALQIKLKLPGKDHQDNTRIYCNIGGTLD